MRRVYERVIKPQLRLLAAGLVLLGVIGTGSLIQGPQEAAEGSFGAAIAAVEAFGEEACVRYESRTGGTCSVVIIGATQGADGIIYVAALLEGDSERGTLVIPAVIAVDPDDAEVLGVAAS